jgi:hypothetical protein
MEKLHIERIESWIRANPRATFLDPAILAKVLRISPMELTRALMDLVQRNVLKVRYKAISPYTHTLTDAEFDSPLEVDNELIDVGENRFRKQDTEIIPVFVGA